MEYSDHLTEEEKARLKELDQEVSVAQQRKTSYLREIFKNRGLIAPTLEELKSHTGEPFVEYKSRNMRGYDYRRASVQVESPIGLQIEDTAYLCREMGLRDDESDPDSCGWVKGEPRAVPYDDIGFLSGSAGKEYYCKLCGKLIGQHQLVVS